jgi:hypothetical protein
MYGDDGSQMNEGDNLETRGRMMEKMMEEREERGTCELAKARERKIRMLVCFLNAHSCAPLDEGEAALREREFH